MLVASHAGRTKLQKCGSGHAKVTQVSGPSDRLLNARPVPIPVLSLLQSFCFIGHRNRAQLKASPRESERPKRDHYKSIVAILYRKRIQARFLVHC